jgi:hypothetical protein
MSAAPHDAPHDALSRSLSCIADARREFLAPIGDKALALAALDEAAGLVRKASEAAPDLLAALRLVRDNNRRGVTGGAARAAWQAVNATIAKAEGRS